MIQKTTLLDALSTAEVFVDGDWVESKDQDTQGDVRLIQLADVGDGYYVDKSNRFLTSDAAKRLKCTFLEPGDVLIARMPDPLGRACIFPGDTKRAVTVVDVCIIRVDPKRMHAPWLVHCTNSSEMRNQISEYVTGTTRQRISRGNLGKIYIALPPLPEQRRIAAILDQADALRAKRREALAQLDSLTQSIFIEMFGDPATNPNKFAVHSLGAICDVRDGTHDSPKYVSSGFPLVTTKNLRDGVIDFTDINLISEADYTAINRRSKVDKGDILMPMIGTIGSPILVCVEPNFAIKNMALIKFTNDSPHRQFILSFLKSAAFEKLVASESKGGTQKFLSLGAIRGLQIPVPPHSLQRKFASAMESVQLQIARTLDSLGAMEKLFVSLQHRAFQGKL